jgi:hypothetical protein
MYNSTSGSLLIPVLFDASANASEHLYELLVPVTERVVALGWLTAFYGVLAVLIVVAYGSDRLSRAKKVVWDAAASESATSRRN